MKLEGCLGWEHKIRDKYCTQCGEIVCSSGFTGCEESDHNDFIRYGYDYCPYCAKDLTPNVVKFPDLEIWNCSKCGQKIERNKYIFPCFGPKHASGNPEDAIFCQL
jgi:hypothetical protein